MRNLTAARGDKIKVIIWVILLIVFFLLSINSAGRRKRPDAIGQTPEATYELVFDRPPQAVFHCGNHVHMAGTTSAYGTKDAAVHVIAANGPDGWRIAEDCKLQTYRVFPDELIALHVFGANSCSKDIVDIFVNPMITPKEDIENGIRDTVGTQFAIYRSAGIGPCNIYGLVDTQQEGYQLFFTEKCIYRAAASD